MYLDPKGWHVAQFNLARMMYSIDDPAMAGFVARLDEINALADASEGFVWRLRDDGGNAAAMRPLGPDVFVNMSLWESIAALDAFTYRSDHVAVMRERKRWFEMPAEAHLVLWWVPARHRPRVSEAKARLNHLRRHGATSHAFTFRTPFRPIQAAGRGEAGRPSRAAICYKLGSEFLPREVSWRPRSWFRSRPWWARCKTARASPCRGRSAASPWPRPGR